jgi:penicillin-binding protein 2
MLQQNLIRRAREQRVALLYAVVVIGFALVAAGLMRLQVAGYQTYRELSKENHVRLEVLRAPRGAIYDRNGVLLADSAPSFSIVFRPFPAESTHKAGAALGSAWLARVAGVLGQDTMDVKRAVHVANANGQTAVLKHNASFEIRAAVEETHDELPGVEVQVEPLRRYPYGVMAAHLLGYAGEINEVELDSLKTDGYRNGDLIGRTGIERSYEQILRGQDGAEFVVVNANGKRVSTLSEGPPRPPQAGHDLVLAVDIRVQQAMEEAMKGVDRGAAVALDPHDGGILGLVSRPAYDPNEFSVGLTVDRWRELTSGGSNPLLNRAIQGVYPPGSTFKVVSMLAALRSGVATPATRVQPCGGRFFYGGRWFGCWKHDGHGSLDFIGALQHSCDVYFYQIGLRLGLPKLEETARGFGLGERTGVDLPQEKRGLIPSEAWYDKRWGAGRWRKGLLLNLAIGQGELLVTPIQLATMLGEVAVDGRPLRPHVVQQVKSNPEFHVARPSHGRLAAPDDAWEALHLALERVVDSGTATMARVKGVRVGGKTGTAQNPHGKDHALFVCYAPVEDPRIVLAFVIENSGHGGSIAAPMAGQVMSKLFLPDSVQLQLAQRVAPADTEAVRGD